MWKLSVAKLPGRFFMSKWVAKRDDVMANGSHGAGRAAQSGARKCGLKNWNMIHMMFWYVLAFCFEVSLTTWRLDSRQKDVKRRNFVFSLCSSWTLCVFDSVRLDRTNGGVLRYLTKPYNARSFQLTLISIILFLAHIDQTFDNDLNDW